MNQLTEFHACSRNACKSEAVATLRCDYMARRVAIVDLEPGGEPDHFDLCSEHLRRFRVPLGWESEDLQTHFLVEGQRAKVSA